MQIKDVKTKADFESYVKEKLSKISEPVLTAQFCKDFIPQTLKTGVLRWYDQAGIQAILLSLPFVTYKDDEHGFKRIQLKQSENQSMEKQTPQFESKDEFEEYLKKIIKPDREYSLTYYIINNFSQSDKQNIATLYGRAQFSDDIFADIPFLRIIENENGVKSVSLRQMDETENQGDQPMENTSLQQMQTEPPTPPAVVYSANEKAKLLLERINAGLYEKEEAVRLAFLAAVACESVFFLGPPGVGKSMICRRLSEVFQGDDGAAWFEYLMNQFSTPDEVSGPVSLKSLENDEYKRITKGYLPEANVAFLDEIWKASPAIQNTLLTIINERKFHNGNKVQKVPLKVLAAASNELPAQGLGLEALWDRFLIRVLVNPIEDDDRFFDMIESTEETDIKIEDELKISHSELEEWRAKINAIEITQEIQDVIRAVRKEMASRNEAMAKGSEDRKDTQEEFYVSDRRWKKIVNILRTSAFLNGREAVDLMDCQLISYCIWSTAEQQKKAGEIVRTCVEQHGLEATTKISELETDKKEFDKKVMSQFYTTQTTTARGDPIVKNYNGYDCYECEMNETTFYIATTEATNYRYSDARYKIFDASDNSAADIDYSISSDKTVITTNKYSSSWANGRYTVKFTKGKTTTKTIKDESVFGKIDVYNATKATFDANYNTIKANIEAEISKIDNFISKKQKPFDENLFADQSMKDVIMKQVKQTKVDLQKLQVELDKIRSKYAQ